MTYLELCQAFVQELGIAGGGANNPTAVTAQTGELLNIVNWIREADLQINNQTMNWRYFWSEYSIALAVADQEPTTPTNPRSRTWIKNSFWLDRNGTNQKKLDWMAWGTLRSLLSVPNAPTRISMKPDGQLRLDAPMSLALTLTGEYYKSPTVLVENADVPVMPKEYHRIILCRAAVIYGGREDAPEIVGHYEPEYIEILDKLEMDQKPERAQEGEPNAYNHIEQTIPGFEVVDDSGFGE